jgi:transporter family-2 protein
MNLPFVALTLFLGVILTVHLAMNGQVGAAINNPRVGNALFWCIGAVTAVIVGFTGWQPGALSGISKINPLLLTAGAMGALLVFAIARAVPEVGPGPFFVLLVAGQVLSGLIVSHFGWFATPVQHLTTMKAAGALIMIIGVYLTTK